MRGRPASERLRPEGDSVSYCRTGVRTPIVLRRGAAWGSGIGEEDNVSRCGTSADQAKWCILETAGCEAAQPVKDYAQTGIRCHIVERECEHRIPFWA